MIEFLEKVMKMEELDKKTALVTGASYGIGFELAKIFAENNYDLILVARTKSKLDSIKKDFSEEYGVKVSVISCDLSNPLSYKDIYEQIKRKNLEVDVLVNNAGMGDWGYFVDSNLEKLNEMLQLNVVALTNLTHLILPGMIKRREGRILNVASTAAFQPGPLMAVYFATKAYVLSFSSAIAQELKDTGVSVTCLCPGPTATGFQVSAFPRETFLTDEKKLARPRDIALYGYKAMLRGKTVAVAGFLNRLMSLSVRFLPQWITLRLVYFLQRED